jgi:hypothetical protein
MRFKIEAHLSGPGGEVWAPLQRKGEDIIVEAKSACSVLAEVHKELLSFGDGFLENGAVQNVGLRVTQID